MLSAAARPHWMKRRRGSAVFDLLLHHSGLPAESSPVETLDDLTRRLTAGMAVLLLDGCAQGIAFSVQSLKFRSVEEAGRGGESAGAPGRGLRICCGST